MELFKQFEPELSKKIQQVGVIRKFKTDDYLMKTGQSIRSAVLVTKGIIKVFREDDEGNEEQDMAGGDTLRAIILQMLQRQAQGGR